MRRCPQRASPGTAAVSGSSCRSPQGQCRTSSIVERIFEVAPALIREREPDDRVAIRFDQRSRLRCRAPHEPHGFCVLAAENVVEAAVDEQWLSRRLPSLLLALVGRQELLGKLDIQQIEAAAELDDRADDGG